MNVQQQNFVQRFHVYFSDSQDIATIQNKVAKLLSCQPSDVKGIATKILDSFCTLDESPSLQAKKIYVLQNVMQQYAFSLEKEENFEICIKKLANTIQTIMLKTDSFSSLILLGLIRYTLEQKDIDLILAAKESVCEIIKQKKFLQFSEEDFLSLQSNCNKAFLEALNGLLASLKDEAYLSDAIAKFKLLEESNPLLKFETKDDLISLAFLLDHSKFIKKTFDFISNKQIFWIHSILFNNQEVVFHLIKEKKLFPDCENQFWYAENYESTIQFLKSLKVDRCLSYSFQSQGNYLNDETLELLLFALSEKIYLTDESMKNLLQKALCIGKWLEPFTEFFSLQQEPLWFLTSLEKDFFDHLINMALLFLSLEKANHLDAFIKTEIKKENISAWKKTLDFLKNIQNKVLEDFSKQGDKKICFDNEQNLKDYLKKIEQVHKVKKGAKRKQT